MAVIGIASVAAPAGPAPEGDASLTIATAASVRFAMEEIAPAFEKETGIKARVVYGASGVLAAQVRNGAPFDVFVSADMEFPDSLHAWGFAAERPRVYAYGKLVLWTTGDLDPALGMRVLTEGRPLRIALADPERAPYGRESLKALRRAGVLEKMRGRLVYGESISQVTQYALTGNVDIAFTAVSVVRGGDLRGKGRWAEVDSALYDPITQGAVICRHGERNRKQAAEGFLAFLRSETARAVLAGYGYGLP
jgi:molybdate transport system substrate-binding protein